MDRIVSFRVCWLRPRRKPQQGDQQQVGGVERIEHVLWDVKAAVGAAEDEGRGEDGEDGENGNSEDTQA